MCVVRQFLFVAINSEFHPVEFRYYSIRALSSSLLAAAPAAADDDAAAI